MPKILEKQVSAAPGSSIDQMSLLSILPAPQMPEALGSSSGLNEPKAKEDNKNKEEKKSKVSEAGIFAHKAAVTPFTKNDVNAAIPQSEAINPISAPVIQLREALLTVKKKVPFGDFHSEAINEEREQEREKIRDLASRYYSALQDFFAKKAASFSQPRQHIEYALLISIFSELYGCGSCGEQVAVFFIQCLKRTIPGHIYGVNIWGLAIDRTQNNHAVAIISDEVVNIRNPSSWKKIWIADPLKTGATPVLDYYEQAPPTLLLELSVPYLVSINEQSPIDECFICNTPLSSTDWLHLVTYLKQLKILVQQDNGSGLDAATTILVHKQIDKEIIELQQLAAKAEKSCCACNCCECIPSWGCAIC